MMDYDFEWSLDKEAENIAKHGVDFTIAGQAFRDPKRIILFDKDHSGNEDRWFCIGKVRGKVVTTRFTMRDNKIRIIGAGYWRKWRKYYEQRN